MKNRRNKSVVAIPHDVKRMMQNQQLIFVGTTNEQGVPNISPRSAFFVDAEDIYWYEIFRHKSYNNFIKNSWVSIAVADSAEFAGYQLKGRVNEVTEKEMYYYADSRISQNIPKAHIERIRDLIAKHDVKIIKFHPVVLYSLNTADFEKIPGLLASDLDIEELPKMENFSMLDYV